MPSRSCIGCRGDSSMPSDDEGLSLQPSVAVPSAAWSRNFWAKPPRRKKPLKPTLMQTIPLMPLGLRMWRRVRAEKSATGEAFMDPFNDWQHDTSHGVPVGGIGCGAMGRGWRGEFRRYSTGRVPAGLVFVTEDTPHTGFSVCASTDTVPSEGCMLLPAPATPAKEVKYLTRAVRAESHQLYPRSWQVYGSPTEGIREGGLDYVLTCEQVSPVIAHDYNESCLPCGAFEWTVDNHGDEDLYLSLMFTVHNGTTADSQKRAEQPHTTPVDGAALVLMPHPLGSDPGSFCVAADGKVEGGYDKAGGVTASVCEQWPASSFSSLWKAFVEKKGDLPCAVVRAGSKLAAVSCKVVVKAREKKSFGFSLAWDFPVARFGCGRGYSLKYAERFGGDGAASMALARHALASVEPWRRKIAAWQQPILADATLRTSYKSALLNEAYFLTAGGSLWTSDGGVPSTDGPDPVGHWLYLEGMEYRMFNTYDVHFYASFAMATLFPLLERSVTRDFARTVTKEWSEPRMFLHSGEEGIRKSRNTVPHDLGGPTEDPWGKPNIYCIHDVARWKDLPLKFVLMVFRNYVALGNDVALLREMWGPMNRVLEECLKSFDSHGSGMIVNEPWPDQTYDAWKAQGTTAYCGGLWLAALRVAETTAGIVGDAASQTRYAAQLSRAQRVYETLWNAEGGYYNYDSSKSTHSDSIMADQCCGEWYLRACGLPSVLPPGHARAALSAVYRLNVQQFGRKVEDGGLPLRGAVNGMRPDGTVDKSSMQSMECWAGTSFAVASHMVLEGMRDEAFDIVEGVAEGIYREFGFWFNTPEAWLIDGSFRSLGYMRPLCVWAVQWSVDRSVVQDGGSAQTGSDRHTDPELFTEPTSVS